MICTNIVACSIVEHALSLYLAGSPTVFGGYWSRRHHIEDLCQVFLVGQWILAIHCYVCSVPGVSG